VQSCAAADVTRRDGGAGTQVGAGYLVEEDAAEVDLGRDQYFSN
jgi:hypothetical protein